MLLQVLISFIVGGLFIALQTLIAEHSSLRWRGIILSIPSTLALGLFFIGLTKTVSDVPEAVLIVPAALGIDYLWVFAFALLSQINLLVGFIGSFTIWGIAAALLLIFPPTSLFSSIFFYGLPLIVITYFLIGKLKQKTKIIPTPITLKHIFIRSCIGGLIIATIVILSKTMGNMWGGLFSTFPAAFSSMFLIYYFVHGKQVIPSVAKSLYFPGTIGFILYAVVAAIVIPKYGIWIGTGFSYLSIVPFYFFYTIAKEKIVSR